MISSKFRPSVLILDENASEKEKGNFLTDELFLEGIIMRACSAHEVFHSNAFMSKIEGESSAPWEKYKKIQDKVFFNAYAKICCNKDLCDRSDCLKSDSYAAEMVVENFENVKNGIPTENVYIENVKLVRSISGDGNSENIREGIRYICKQTGYTELAFPVRLYGRVMGAFIAGQIIAERNKREWRETIEQKCLAQKYKKEKIEMYRSFANEAKTEKEIEEIVKKVSQAVDDIEKDLKIAYEERQRQFELEQGNIYVELFKRIYKTGKKEIEDANTVYPAAACIEVYRKLGQCIRDCIHKVCSAAGVDKYILYLPDEKNLIENDYKKLKSGEAELDVHALTTENPDKTLLCGQEFVNRYVKKAVQPYDCIIVSRAEGYPIALALCIEEFLQDVEDDEEKRLLRESLSNIFRHIFSYVQIFGIQEKAEYFKAYLDSSMSIMRHELGQSNAGYQTLLEKFKKSVDWYQRNVFDGQSNPIAVVSDEFIENCGNFIKDSEKYLHITKIRVQSTKYLTEFEPKEEKFFYPYEEFLFKWWHIYYKNAEDSNLEFDFPHVTSYDPSRPRMYGDPLMVEQAVYNLTNNAIKYAMQGTKVSLDCKLNADKTKYEIRVKNIGHPISEEEKNTILEYGKRGSNNEKKGSGLGLYLTRQIALAHGGDVECKVKKLSDYNWSLVEAYIKLFEDRNLKHFCKKEELYEKLRKEWGEKKSEIEKCIVRKIPRNAFSPMYVQHHIRQGTAEFEFTFWLPYWKGERIKK